ncbi:MAG: AtpZ/AtpI family protein [Lachnospiraceae bacterium]|nr:AtpZ/AtpI family protein [Lachnospiraceae bacterium]
MFYVSLCKRGPGVRFNKNVYRTIALVTQFGINMLVPIFMCSFLGIWLDRKLGTNFIMIILFFIGAVSGGYNVYRLSKRYLKKDDPYSAYRHGASFYDDESRTDEDEGQDKQDSI